MHEHAQKLTDSPREGRALPKALGITTAGAKRFWKTWASAPQTAAWGETDWAELEITTVLVDRFHQGDTKLAGEIRLRVAKWGATTEDRARLRMSFDKHVEDESNPTEPNTKVVAMDRYKQAFG
ncbi:hypothetical protein [Streptomyces noursei]|uniref:phage terminase small subunit n=1 Tax=Streptomyces noursei TaxID=1971 RepID=UPI001E2AEA33|nr:hypothetical protein [Streptomyces noursei]MCZ1015602.1 hypothetical protein [Streptomyces noursei]